MLRLSFYSAIASQVFPTPREAGQTLPSSKAIPPAFPGGIIHTHQDLSRVHVLCLLHKFVVKLEK